MAVNKRIKMDVSNRAKQFMPFAALKGLPEALAQKEEMMEKKQWVEKIPLEDAFLSEIMES